MHSLRFFVITFTTPHRIAGAFFFIGSQSRSNGVVLGLAGAIKLWRIRSECLTGGGRSENPSLISLLIKQMCAHYAEVRRLALVGLPLSLPVIFETRRKSLRRIVGIKWLTSGYNPFGPFLCFFFTGSIIEAIAVPEILCR